MNKSNQKYNLKFLLPKVISLGLTFILMLVFYFVVYCDLNLYSEKDPTNIINVNINYFKILSAVYSDLNNISMVILAAIPILLLLITAGIIVFSLVKIKASKLLNIILSGSALFLTLVLIVKILTMSTSVGLMYIPTGEWLYLLATICSLILSIVEPNSLQNQKAPAFTNQPNYYDDPPTVLTTGTLVGLSGEYAGAEIPMKNGEEIVIGRSASSCSLIVSNDVEFISGTHCKVKYEDGYYYLMDFSTNGTYINNNPIDKNVWIKLNKETQFTLARSSHIFLVK